MKKYKINSPHKKLLMIILYIIIITMFDVYSYGIVYQQKIQKENYHHPVWSWIFEGKQPDTNTGEIIVIRYRVIQKSLEVTGILIIFYFCGLLPAAGLVISHYLLAYDMLFYLILDKGFIFDKLHKTVNPFWLQNWYQSGYFLLRPYSGINLFISGTAGIIIAVSCCYLRKNKQLT